MKQFGNEIRLKFVVNIWPVVSGIAENLGESRRRI